MILRPYQEDVLERTRQSLRVHRCTCVVMPTGSGKTVVFTRMGHGVVKKGNSAWFIGHRDHILDQISSALSKFDVPHGFVRADHGMTPAPVQVAMIQSLKNRLHRLPPPDLVVIDEGHHTPASTYAGLYAALPSTTKFLLFTATPERLDGKGLGSFASDMVEGPTIAELISDGYLCPAECYAPKLVDTSQLHTRHGEFVSAESEALLDRPAIIGDALEHYKRIANGTSFVMFCATVRTAYDVCAEFNKGGVPSAVLEGNMTRAERAAVMKPFEAGEIKGLMTCQLISEGYDLPRLETVIDYAPTQSLAVYLQRYGRALRIYPGKTKAIIIDHVQNMERHGRYDQARAWTLEGRRA